MPWEKVNTLKHGPKLEIIIDLVHFWGSFSDILYQNCTEKMSNTIIFIYLVIGDLFLD